MYRVELGTWNKGIPCTVANFECDTYQGAKDQCAILAAHYNVNYSARIFDSEGKKLAILDIFGDGSWNIRELS